MQRCLPIPLNYVKRKECLRPFQYPSQFLKMRYRRRRLVDELIYSTAICHHTQPAAFQHSHRYARACSLGIMNHDSTEMFRRTGYFLGGKHTLGRVRTIPARSPGVLSSVTTLPGIPPLLQVEIPLGNSPIPARSTAPRASLTSHPA